MISIASATDCSCGESVLLTELPPRMGAPKHRWQAHCERCIVPCEGMASAAYVVGFGDSPRDALWDWQSVHDEAYAATLVLVSTIEDVLAQARAEFAQPMQLVPGWLTPKQAADVGLPHRQTDVLYCEPRLRPAYPIPGGSP